MKELREFETEELEKLLVEKEDKLRENIANMILITELQEEVAFITKIRAELYKRKNV